MLVLFAVCKKLRGVIFGAGSFAGFEMPAFTEVLGRRLRISRVN